MAAYGRMQVCRGTKLSAKDFGAKAGQNSVRTIPFGQLYSLSRLLETCPRYNHPFHTSILGSLHNLIEIRFMKLFSSIEAGEHVICKIDSDIWERKECISGGFKHSCV
jgi:hypothetical protein